MTILFDMASGIRHIDRCPTITSTKKTGAVVVLKSLFRLSGIDQARYISS
jgi:hypothetical protein